MLNFGVRTENKPPAEHAARNNTGAMTDPSYHAAIFPRHRAARLAGPPFWIDGARLRATPCRQLIKYAQRSRWIESAGFAGEAISVAVSGTRRHNPKDIEAPFLAARVQAGP